MHCAKYIFLSRRITKLLREGGVFGIEISADFHVLRSPGCVYVVFNEVLLFLYFRIMPTFFMETEHTSSLFLFPDELLLKYEKNNLPLPSLCLSVCLASVPIFIRHIIF